ncbi:MAG: squalene--hopene cyclase [Alphaproteobacteria bacterium]|nr:squalene--hopene cyclase [Alphaproteobacteria bacterium]
MSDAATTDSRARAAPVSALDQAVDRAAAAMIAHQNADGHWCYELEADATIPAEYMLLQHYLGEIDDDLQQEFAVYLRATQGEHGGWPLFYGGDVDLSATVKAYFALKAAGDLPDAPHMAKARAAILARGGAARSNVFTRIQLALFGELPWTAVPEMPVEITLLPRWFPFHLSKVSYWSRAVIVPLLVLMALKPRAKNPRGVGVRELFAPGTQAKPPRASGSPWAWVFNRIDDVLRFAEPYMPAGSRRRAIDAAVRFVVERLNGDDGLGGIYPAIANSVMMFECLGYAKDDPALRTAKSALRKLVVRAPQRSYCQPCLSPVWDTALAAHALLEVGDRASDAAARRGLDWLAERQVVDLPGDWAAWRPNVRPGGWAFQYANPHYPDLDDTAVVAMAFDRADRAKWREPVARASEWLVGMQCRTGGWAAFDADNEYYYLNYIPFADHGALLDPPTEDVSARCMSLFAQRGDKGAAFARGLDYLRRTQLPDGSWFGRWGTNYIYGTWSVLCALNVVGVAADDPMVQRAVAWLVSKQRADGGWGEDGASYWRDRPRGEGKASTASQTAWALLALMAAGEIDNPAMTRGIEYLLRTQQPHGLWDEAWYTAVGFPRVFYLRYHGYRAYFPLWALARYRALRRTGARRTIYGM